jgi:hypothetical protein
MTTRMNVSFPPRLLTELKRRIPARRRSDFIASAVEEKLARGAQLEAVAAAAGAWSDEGRSDPSDEIRALRDSWTEARPAPASWVAEPPAAYGSGGAAAERDRGRD